MTTSVDLNSEPGIAIANGYGLMKLDDIQECAQTLWKATNGQATRMLWDLRSVTFDINVDDVRQFAEFAKKLFSGPDVRSAFVASTDFEYGLIRMFEMFREAPGFTTQVFRDRDAAIEWLKED